MRPTRDFFGFRIQQTYERGALISENVLILGEFCFLELSQISWASKVVRKALVRENCCFWVNSDSQNSVKYSRFRFQSTCDGVNCEGGPE